MLFWADMLLDCAVHRADLSQRIAGARELIATAHPNGTTTNISRDARGLAIVLLYAAYENLLTALCRSLLETVKQLKVGNRRLRSGLKVVAAHSRLMSMSAVSASGIWKSGFDVVDAIHESRACTVSTDTFPNDGSHFRQPQVMTFCKIFGLGDPAPILQQAWQRLDSIVSERNAVAHGRMTPSEVGRSYSLADISQLIDVWEERWLEFINWVETSASSRDFFRMPR
jgi:hypothetical protein